MIRICLVAALQLLALGISRQALAVADEQASKIVGFVVLNRNASQESKVVGFTVLCTPPGTGTCPAATGTSHIRLVPWMMGH